MCHREFIFSRKGCNQCVGIIVKADPYITKLITQGWLDCNSHQTIEFYFKQYRCITLIATRWPASACSRQVLRDKAPRIERFRPFPSCKIRGEAPFRTASWTTCLFMTSLGRELVIGEGRKSSNFVSHQFVREMVMPQGQTDPSEMIACITKEGFYSLRP